MTVKEYLYQIRHERREIDELNDRIEELHCSLLPAGIRYDSDKVQSSPDDQMSRIMAEIADYSAQLSEAVWKLTVRRRKAHVLIQSLADSRERQVLDLFFLSDNRMRMADIADVIGYSVQHAYRFYESGLNNLDAIWQDESE